MHVVSIVGARPQFVKASMVSRELMRRGAREELVHTGQHYDHGMSAVFFEELGIPEPSRNLGVGSGTHAAQTGDMMVGIERLLLDDRPDAVLVYGDTNSTLAGALAAAKLHVPVAHVEAGLRSFNRTMPEEINRILADHVSDLLFCPTETAVSNLAAEGLTGGVVRTGDVMLDATRHFADRAADRAPLSGLTGHGAGEYAVATIHRAGNVDDPAVLRSILDGLGRTGLPVILPLHPRTAGRLEGMRIPENVEIRDPVGYLAMLTLVRHARCVLTDSGGLQKEALWLSVPCITLRDETEWVETLQGGWNRLVGADPDRIRDAVRERPVGPPPSFGVMPEAPASVLIADALARAT
jgi:UDP-N-acetylglucosamine 2-epimerase